jgi:hypothetical protein
MIQITPKQVSAIKRTLAELYPNFTFQVKTQEGKTLALSILESPYDFRPDKRKNESFIEVHHYFLKSHKYNHRKILQNIIRICNDGNWGKCDLLTDHFGVGWFFKLTLGTKSKPFTVK